ncbi:latrophilin-like protein LAT-2 [Mercenaria mercenaria]|uniref:latrophilin-like protein LAT-2 n=1 Tax=Mercenaria mercenaria TaxID=6596 RepID=UPI00234F1A16|nr:latrophilin-like protein LAT-2 [Mercenaria mercenaria]
MCTHMFEELMKPFAETGKQLERINKCVTKTLSTSAILSPVCTSISLTFSVLTLIIYLRFKELKTQPGINNIVLCIALIIAQTLFQFGSGQACNVSKVACQIIGILVHFSWLFLIFWMNSCCIHMFRVFRLNRTRMALFNTIKTTVVYILYSFIAALIFVLINVSVSLQGSAGHDIGYGGSMCYINKDYMVAYLFALPVAVIVSINIILFIIVTFQMKMSPKVQNDKNERNLLYIYARLSTLTGGTWIFGFFSYFFNVVALDVIFIILNATQGIFLFIAFVANRRTLSLLRKNEHKQAQNTSKTQTYSNDRGTNTGNETILSTRSDHYIQSN